MPFWKQLAWAALLSPVAAGAYYLSVNGHGQWRTVGVVVGLAYIALLIWLRRRLD
jgi:hypothetical protein